MELGRIDVQIVLDLRSPKVGLVYDKYSLLNRNGFSKTIIVFFIASETQVELLEGKSTTDDSTKKHKHMIVHNMYKYKNAIIDGIVVDVHRCYEPLIEDEPKFAPYIQPKHNSFPY